MGKGIKISRIKYRNTYYNVVTGSKSDLMAMSFGLLKASTGESCPVLMLSSNSDALLVAREDLIKKPTKMNQCISCKGVKSCPVARVLKAHKDNWKRNKGNISKGEKPRKTPSKYIKIKVE